MILVLLGTQDLPFNRLLQAVDKLVETGEITQPVFAQTGYSTYTPRHCQYKSMVPFEEFDKLLGKSSLVISHGGTGSLVGALKKGKKVIAVPRLRKYGEHVDDHQTEIVNAFAQAGLLLRVNEMHELKGALHKVDGFVPNKYISGKQNVMQLLEAFIDSV